MNPVWFCPHGNKPENNRQNEFQVSHMCEQIMPTRTLFNQFGLSLLTLTLHFSFYFRYFRAGNLFDFILIQDKRICYT